MVFVAPDLADFPDGKTTLRYMAAKSLLDGLPSTLGKARRRNAGCSPFRRPACREWSVQPSGRPS